MNLLKLPVGDERRPRHFRPVVTSTLAHPVRRKTPTDGSFTLYVQHKSLTKLMLKEC